MTKQQMEWIIYLAMSVPIALFAWLIIVVALAWGDV